MNLSNNPIIFCAVNKHYLCFADLFFKCLEKHYPKHPDIVVCLVDCLLADIGNIQLPSRTHVFELSGDFSASWPGCEHSPQFKFPAATYARYAIFSGAMSDYANILYLDIDTLVLAPLDDLFLPAPRISAALDWLQKPRAVFTDPENPALLSLMASDNFKMPKNIFNAGVMVIPAVCRTTRNYNSLTELTSRYADHIAYADQSIFNLWAENRAGGFQELPIYYNFQKKLFLYKIYSLKELSQIKVLHFSSMWKGNAMRLFVMSVFCGLSVNKPLLLFGLSFYNIFLRLKFLIKRSLVRTADSMLVIFGRSKSGRSEYY